MEERLKQRLIGGAVLVSLMVIFVPMLLEEQGRSEQNFSETRIPDKPITPQYTQANHSILPEPIDRMEAVPADPPVETLEPQEPPEPIVEEVETVQQKPASLGQGTPAAWMVQVASFSKQENAERLVAELKQANLSAQVKIVTIKQKQHYRVQMLPQLDKQEADDLVKRIQKEFGLKASVVRYAG